MARKKSPNEIGMWEILPLGDSALVLRFGDEPDKTSEQRLDRVLDAMQRIVGATVPGIVDLAPAYNSIGIFFDAPDSELLEEQIRVALGKFRPIRRQKISPRKIDIPICFHDELAFDLADVATRAQLSPNEVVDLYCSAQYRVSSVGFTPGFPYLIGLPDKLATPRRATPRKEIPAGSVAIGGSHTGIYPTSSPGGWNVIGRTTLQLFHPKRNPPALFQIGDHVCFHAVTRDEFERSTS